jgi:hypothetical protein
MQQSKLPSKCCAVTTSIHDFTSKAFVTSSNIFVDTTMLQFWLLLTGIWNLRRTEMMVNQKVEEERQRGNRERCHSSPHEPQLTLIGWPTLVLTLFAVLDARTLSIQCVMENFAMVCSFCTLSFGFSYILTSSSSINMQGKHQDGKLISIWISSRLVR